MRLALSVGEAADFMGISPWRVRQLVKQGHLAKIPHLGSQVRIAEVECRRFMAQGVKPEEGAA